MVVVKFILGLVDLSVQNMDDQRKLFIMNDHQEHEGVWKGQQYKNAYYEEGGSCALDKCCNLVEAEIHKLDLIATKT